MYTRSAFSLPWDRMFWNAGNISKTQEFITPLDFPPYKISPDQDINGRTSIMSSVY
jgi:hypothetical protein